MGVAEKKDIWVHADLRSEKLFRLCLKVLSKARDLARKTGGKTAAVLTFSSRAGEGTDETGSVPAGVAAGRCIARGADLVYLLDDPDLYPPRADVFAAALLKAIGEHEPMLVLFPLTDMGRELSARLARAENAGSIAKCLDLEITDGRVTASCAYGGGERVAKIAFAKTESTMFATMQTAALRELDARGDPGSSIQVDLGRLERPRGVTLKSRSLESEAAKRLEDAEIVVVGGAGLGTTEGFGLARELAAFLGGELGATRPPVLQHWTREDRLIGQTGKTVRPRLLFSIGTSGAIQYTTGIADAGTIVAVNRDPSAPIFHSADFGIAADAKTFLAELNTAIKQTMMKGIKDTALAGEPTTEPGAGVGDKIRRLREAKQLSVEELAGATDQSPEFIEQVEAGDATPSVAFLLRMARALGTAPDAFLSRQDRDQIRDQRVQAFMTRTQNYSYQTLTPGAEVKHLRAFKVVIEPRQTHKPVAYKHEGEELIIVDQGELELTLGSKTHVLKPGESIHFNSEIPHKLKSRSDTPTQCTVILYTP